MRADLAVLPAPPRSPTRRGTFRRGRGGCDFPAWTVHRRALGGSTPRDTYRQLATEALMSRVTWSRVHVLWGRTVCCRRTYARGLRWRRATTRAASPVRGEITARPPRERVLRPRHPGHESLRGELAVVSRGVEPPESATMNCPREKSHPRGRDEMSRGRVGEPRRWAAPRDPLASTVTPPFKNKRPPLFATAFHFRFYNVTASCTATRRCLRRWAHRELAGFPWRRRPTSTYRRDDLTLQVDELEHELVRRIGPLARS